MHGRSFRTAAVSSLIKIPPRRLLNPILTHFNWIPTFPPFPIFEQWKNKSFHVAVREINRNTKLWKCEELDRKRENKGNNNNIATDKIINTDNKYGGNNEAGLKIASRCHF